jgi:hypothetical protein
MGQAKERGMQQQPISKTFLHDLLSSKLQN